MSVPAFGHGCTKYANLKIESFKIDRKSNCVYRQPGIDFLMGIFLVKLSDCTFGFREALYIDYGNFYEV